MPARGVMGSGGGGGVPLMVRLGGGGPVALLGGAPGELDDGSRLPGLVQQLLNAVLRDTLAGELGGGGGGLGGGRAGGGGGGPV